jgi:uncharacterized protein (DUF427 family)
VTAGGRRLEDAAWSYEEPFDEHVALAGRIAFHAGERPQIVVRTSRPAAAARSSPGC